MNSPSGRNNVMASKVGPAGGSSRGANDKDTIQGKKGDSFRDSPGGFGGSTNVTGNTKYPKTEMAKNELKGDNNTTKSVPGFGGGSKSLGNTAAPMTEKGKNAHTGDNHKKAPGGFNGGMLGGKV